VLWSSWRWSYKYFCVTVRERETDRQTDNKTEAGFCVWTCTEHGTFKRTGLFFFFFVRFLSYNVDTYCMIWWCKYCGCSKSFASAYKQNHFPRYQYAKSYIWFSIWFFYCVIMKTGQHFICWMAAMLHFHSFHN